MRKRLSLRNKLILATVVSGLIPIVLGLGFSYWSARETMRTSIGNDFRELAKSTARHVDLIIEREMLEARNLALEPLVRTTVMEANRDYEGLDDIQRERLLAERQRLAQAGGLSAVPSTSQALAQRLKAYQGLGGEYYQIMVTDRYGAPLAAIREPPTYVQRDFAWWKQAIAGNLYISDVGHTPDGEATLALAVPVLGTDGTPAGVVLMVHYIDDLFHPLVQVGVGRTGHVNLIDSSGRLIVEPGRPAPISTVEPALLKTVSSSVEGWTVTREEHRGVDAIVAFAPVELTTRGNKNFGEKKWYVFIRQDAAEAFAPTAELLSRGIALGVVLIFLLAFLGVFLAQSILQPLEKLHSWGRQLGEGRLDERLYLQTGDEIQDLAEVFNHTAEQLQSLYQDLEAKVDERTRELATLNAIALTTVQSLGLGDVLDAAVAQVKHTLGMSEAWILLPKTAGKSDLHVVARHGELAPPLGAPAGDGQKDCRCVQVFKEAQETVMVHAGACPWLVEVGRRRHACIPLRSKGRTVGILNVAQRSGANKNLPLEGLLPLLTAIGAQIGVAVDNALLYEEVQRKEALRGHLLQRAITAQEEERKRVARELHDEFAQTLTALIMSLEAAEAAIPPDLDAVRQHLMRTKKLTAQTLNETRQLIVELRPTLLDDLGLLPAIRWYARLVLEPRHIRTQIHVRGEQRRLKPELETVLFRIAQESLSNVARHAGATKAEISLLYKPDEILLEVADNGQGFDASVVLDPDDPTRSLGIRGIQERVFLAGGKLDIDSGPGKGTTIRVVIPAAMKTDD